MKKILFLFMAMGLFPVWTLANTLQDRLLSEVRTPAAKPACAPKVNIWGMGKFTSAPEAKKYIAFLKAQTQAIMAEAEEIPLEELKQRKCMGVELLSLPDQARETIKSVAALGGSADSVTEHELMILLVLLDAQLGVNPATNKQAFHLDGCASVGEDSGLVQSRPAERMNLFKLTAELTRAHERKLAAQAAERARLLESVKQKLANLPAFDNQGNFNKENAAKAMEQLVYIGRDENNFQTLAKKVFSSKGQTQLKKIEVYDRQGDLSALLADGTKLEFVRPSVISGGGILSVYYPDNRYEEIKVPDPGD